MPVKQVKKTTSKHKLLKVGSHYVSPEDVAGFKQAKKGLYILQLKSQPEPQFPLWLTKEELEQALPFFEILGV